MKLSLIAIFILLVGCAGKNDVSIPAASQSTEQHFCDINCQTGGLDGWYNVPVDCQQDAQANSSAPDWYMNCDGLTYTRYDGKNVGCTMPQLVCQ